MDRPPKTVTEDYAILDSVGVRFGRSNSGRLFKNGQERDAEPNIHRRHIMVDWERLLEICEEHLRHHPELDPEFEEMVANDSKGG